MNRASLAGEKAGQTHSAEYAACRRVADTASIAVYLTQSADALHRRHLPIPGLPGTP